MAADLQGRGSVVLYGSQKVGIIPTFFSEKLQGVYKVGKPAG